MTEHTMLIVDSEPVLRQTLAQSLRRAGHVVVEANDLASAFRQLLDHNPAAVLIADGLEGQEGLARRLCRQLRALPGCDHLVILLLTHGRDEKDVCSALESGITDVVSQPIVYPVLENRLSELLRAQATARELQRKERRLRQAQRVARLGDWRLNSATDALACSAEMLRILGRSSADAPGTIGELVDCVHPEDASLVSDALCEALERGTSFHFECRIVTSRGAVRTVHLGGECESVGPRGDLELVGSLHDLTDHRHQQAQLRYLAYYDGVTRLPNATMFESVTRRQIDQHSQRSPRPFAQAAVRIDNLGLATEPLTREEGDEALRLLGQRLQGVLNEYAVGNRSRSRRRLRDRRDRIARTSADVFTLLLDGVGDREQARVFAERLRREAQVPLRVGSQLVHLRATAASVTYPADAQDADGLSRALEATLATTDRGGEAPARAFEPLISQQLRARATRESLLRSALANGLLVLHYQPRVGLDRTIVGAEALVRMRAEDGSLVPPGEFIALAEELGLIGELGYAVASQAVRQLRSWQSVGLVNRRFVMSVNVSPKQLEEPKFFQRIAQILANEKVAPSCLELEITEDALMSDPSASTRLLQARRDLGLRIAIDDYGSGYSGLNYLRDLPADTLKIDRGFISKLGSSQTDELIVQFTIQLAQALGLRVCAEGVENEAQLDTLASLRCDEVQGYLFGKPVEAAAFSQGLMSGEVRATPPRSVPPTPVATPALEPAQTVPDDDAGVVLLDDGVAPGDADGNAAG